MPDTARFDSNCITPGTAFMVRLQNALKYFIKQKVSTNELWKKCRIILSGHEVCIRAELKRTLFTIPFLFVRLRVKESIKSWNI